MTAQTALKSDEHYSWKDYLGWPDSERWEIIAGDAYAMPPSPLPVHQVISAELHSRMQAYFKGKKCRVFAASPVFADLNIPLSEVFEFALEQYAAGPTVVKEPPAHYKTLTGI